MSSGGFHRFDGVLCGVSRISCGISGDPRRLVRTAQESNLDNGDGGQHRSEKREHSGERGDRIARRPLPEGTFVALGEIFGVGFFGTLAVCLALGLIGRPNRKTKRSHEA